MMKQYSQHKMKVAATEPEHVVRKAEFDIAVYSLDERIGVIEQTLDGRPTGPEVLSAKPDHEIVKVNDTLQSPHPIPVSEYLGLSENAEGIKPTTQFGEFSNENMATNDDVASPQTVPLVETTTASNQSETIMPKTLKPDYETENTSLADLVAVNKNGERIMENSHIQGEIEVVVENKNGEVKSRQTITNAITDVFLRYAFFDMMNGGTLPNVLRSNIRSGYNFLARTLPSSLGIYALDRNIDVREETFLPPYVTGDLNTLDPGVVFYNVGGSATEDSQVMIPVDQRCFFDHTKRELVVEYVKNTGYGVVKSVCVGRAHSAKTQMYSVTQTETAVPNQWTATAANYLVEHHATAGTSLWKPASTTAQYRFNLKSRTMETFNSSPLYSNIVGTNSTGGIVVGDHLFKVVKQSATGSSYTIRLHYVLNFKTASTAAYKDIVLTTGEGMSVATDTMPVMVHRLDTGNLEIFVAISSGNHDDEMGVNIRKVTVSSLDNPASMTTETTDLGLLPYCVSNFGTTAALYLTGYHDGTHYYLPYTSTIDSAGRIDMVAENAFQNGIVISSDFKSVSRVFNMRNSTAGPNLMVRADTGLLQCQANDSKIPYIFMSQVVSGANLPQASVKELDDVLRIVYRYRLV